MIEELKNPLTQNYLLLKKEVLGKTFAWYWTEYSTYNKKCDGYTDVPFYSHCVLERPTESMKDNLYPRVTSEKYIDIVNEVIKEIAIFNSFEINSLFRVNFNCTYYIDGNPTIPHVDHNFPHKNLLIYLNDAAGETIVYGDEKTHHFQPKEDAIISFEGLHSGGQPLRNQRRIIMIATYC